MNPPHRPAASTPLPLGGLVAALLVVSPVLAQSDRPLTPTFERVFSEQPGPREEGGWQATLSPFAEYTFEAPMGEADLSVARAGAELSGQYWFDDRFALSLAAGAEYSHYDFSGFRAEAGIAPPIEDAMSFSLRPGFIAILGRQWSLFGAVGANWSGDVSAEAGDSLTWSAFGGARYQVNPDLSFSFAAGVASQLEDKDLLPLPVLGVNWQFAEGWRFDVLGAGAGFQARVSHQPVEAWSLAVSAKIEGRDFRFDDGSSVPGGVLRDDRITGEFSVRYSPQAFVDVTAAVGVVAHNKLTIENSVGGLVYEEHAEPAAQLGLRAAIRF